jgi:Asp-tRNA(Asn)/Glu-tRNA(Gln) amidotransferase C subunit
MLEEKYMDYEREKKMRKKILAVLVAILVMGLLIACGQGQEEEIRRQLERLDSESLSDIMEWIDNELPEFEGVELSLWSITDEDDLIREGILEDEERFINFTFNVGEMDDGEILVFIDLVYETLDLGQLIREELDALSTTSLSDIIDWIEQAEEAFDTEVWINARSIDVDGDWINSDIIDSEEQFVEWEYNIDDTFRFSITVNIYAVYNSVKTFALGETFERDGLEITFYEDIVWGQVDNEWSRDDGVEFFKVPVTIENVSSSTNTRFSPRQFGPDGTSLDSIWVSGVDDDITSMGGLRPGAYHVGYLYFRFEGDGYYIAELWDTPFDIEVIIPIDSDELRRLAPTPPPEPVSDSSLEEFAQELEEQIGLFEDLLDDMIRIEVSSSGENELIITYIYSEVVPAGNIGLVEEFMDYLVEDMMVFFSITAFRMMLELGLDDVIITTVFIDSAGTEFFSSSVEFPL